MTCGTHNFGTGPAARKHAREHGGDTAAADSAPPDLTAWQAYHASYGPVRQVKLTRFEQLAAANLTAVQRAVPTVTHHDQADVSVIEEFRQSLKAEAQQRGIRLTALAFHVRALAQTLAEFPRFNSSLDPDGQTLWLKEYCHIGIAVDTPHGLMIPVLRDVNRTGLWRIAAMISDLAQRATQRKIRPHETAGASMTITNLGAAGGLGFTPIINPPEVAILGISRTTTAPVWNGTVFVPAPLTPLDLSYDHRVVNGAAAAGFMTRYCQLLAEPWHLLL